MQTRQPRKSLFDPRWSLIFLGYIGLLILISVLAYRSQLVGILTSHDKLGHFVLFGTAGLLGHLSLRQRHWSIGSISIPVGPFLIALMVIVDELCQLLSKHRTAGLADLAANWLGIAFFVLLFRLWLCLRRSTRMFKNPNH